MKQTEEYLKETRYCDFYNSEIIRFAENITTKANTDTEKAIMLFYWVRDNIPYTLGSWSKKASEVLKRRKGMCTSKAVLLVSLLRAIKIPAGFGVLRVKGQNYLGPIALPIFKKRIGEESIHIYAYVNLKNKWIRIDPSADKVLSDKTSYFNPTTDLVDWDGKNDAVENLDPKNIIEDLGPISNIDERLDKKPRNAKGVILKIGNIYLDYLRKREDKVTSIEQLQEDFFQWLRKNHFLYYLAFKIVYKYRDFKNNKYINGKTKK